MRVVRANQRMVLVSNEDSLPWTSPVCTTALERFVLSARDEPVPEPEP